ncbi:MAG: AAA family ATPase [Pirellulaceae bacterium]
MAWQGGFLDGTAIHFNENLNVLVGGRGTGKSTIVESLRYVLGLEPIGEEATKAHEGVVRGVLTSGTKISLLVRSHRPSRREYLIERTVPNPSVVRDDTGDVLTLTPMEVVPQVEVYGQHEISELSKSPDKRTRLLDRFVDEDPGLAGRKRDVGRELEKSRARILDVHEEMKQIEERLASLPAIEEKLKRFKDAGLDEQLKERSLIVREEQVLKTASGRIEPFREVLDQMQRGLAIDCAFLSDRAIEGLPGREILVEARSVLERLSQDLEKIAAEMVKVIARSDERLEAVHAKWVEHKRSADEAYERILRELQKAKVDGAEFIRVREQVEQLRPLKEKQMAFQRHEGEYASHRRNLLAEWEDVKSEQFRRLAKAAKKVSKQLAERVRVKVTAAGNRSPLSQLLRERVGGRLSEAIDALESRDDLSLSAFAGACRKGREELAQEFEIPLAQAERITQAPAEVIMRIEELDLSPTTEIELNVAGEDQPAAWRKLDELSTGQKATAVLLLLLLESEAPLIVDQPEDDLDNRFITDGVVPKMREEKRLRQFVFATHNANIPVLGDAELILGLKASGEAGQGKAEIPIEHMGSIDAKPVCDLVEELLEGGKDAFETRRLKYGF